MNPETRARIESSAVFVCFLPVAPDEEQDLSEMLDYAMDLGRKLIIVTDHGAPKPDIPYVITSREYPHEVYDDALAAAERVKDLTGDQPETHVHQLSPEDRGQTP